jgi:integrase
VTSRRGRGEDSVYLDGDRWRVAASLGYGPDGRRIRKKVSGATKAEGAAQAARLAVRTQRRHASSR